jgi:hypothetical protein
MLDEIIRRTALEHLVGAVRSSDPKIRELLGELYWDNYFIYKFGIPLVPSKELTIPFPSQPQPDPSLIYRLQIHEEILMNLVAGTTGDPDPEPNLRSVLENNELRLTAAKNLRQRLETAIYKLDEEISRLA